MMPKVRLNVDAVACSFLNMVLSLRGSERQAPNILQMALRFSAIMEIRANEGVHAKDLNTEQRLRKVIAEHQETPGFLQKWALDDDRVQAILNIIIGTSQQTREIIREHLNHAKWAQSCLNSELLRRPRWLLGACPKGVSDTFKKTLTVNSRAQEMFMGLVVAQFYEKTRKVRATQRAKMRLKPAEWDSYITYASVFEAAMTEAKALNAAREDCQEQLQKAFDAMCLNLIIQNFKIANM